ncbi:MAG TPA: alpha/beta fold hydrolase [Acidimicrobiales bacterium]|nr:alpha/beta fold hydrolase [Acidimicrobiales bacterium]
MADRLEFFEHDGLTFDVTHRGPADGRTVVMLHGFPEDRHEWSTLAETLIGDRYRVLAPDQRGYSPGASPRDRSAYRMEALVSDVLALADAAGADRMDLVGHDWGAAVSWALAARYPERVRSLCALSVPHPGAMRQAVRRVGQALRSSYVVFFQLPWLPEHLLSAGNGHLMANGLERSGLDRPTARRFAARAAVPRALTGPLNWYRAVPLDGMAPPAHVQVPTLFVWGDRDRYIGRAAAEACAQWVDGSYRFVALAGRTHWLPTTATEEVAAVLGEHLGTVPV